jgi:hypothetical protein
MRNSLLQLFRVSLLAAVSTVAIGCTDVYNAAPSYPGYDWKSTGVYLPFVESVELPDSVIAGAPFEVAIHVSAQANPDALAAISDESCSQRPRLDSAASWTGAFPVNYLVRPWSDPRATQDDDPTTVRVAMVLDFPGAPGLQRIAIASASSRETGGMLGYFFHYPWRDQSADGFKGPIYKYYEIEVLPGEGG